MKKILLIVSINIFIFFVLCFAFNSFLKIGMNSYFSLADILRARYQNNSVVEKIISDIDKFLGCYNVEGETYEYADDEVEPVTIKQIPITPKLAEEYCGHDRLRYNTDSTRNPIVTLGGSYVYGHGLKEEKHSRICCQNCQTVLCITFQCAVVKSLKAFRLITMAKFLQKK